MDTINRRLDIFEKSGFILESEKKVLSEWMEIIKAYSSVYDEEKIERMLTHCAMMMKRQRNHEKLEELPEDIHVSIKEHKNYKACKVLLEKMTVLYPVTEQEKQYLLLHLCNCFA